MTQERKHLRKDVPQMLKQQIPNHQLHKISHKTSPSEQQPQGASTMEQQPRGKAATDTQQGPVPSQFTDDDELPDAFAIPQRLLRRKILDLYQRNQNIVYDQKHSTFNPLYLFLIFSLQIKKR